MVFYVRADSPDAQNDDREAAGLRMLAVDESARGRGIGQSLTNWCIDMARTEGHTRIRLHTQTTMASAQRPYGRLGFIRDPEANWDPPPGVRLLGYVKELRKSSGRRVTTRA